MRAIEFSQYGPPSVLQFIEVAKPEPKPNEVLVKIHAGTVTTTETYFRQGKPFITRFFTGLFKPKLKRLGEEIAGEIESVGAAVTRFKAGDKVFGTAGPNFGGNAEYLCVPEDGVLMHMPSNLTYAEAASCVDGVLTALPFLRDGGKIQAGQKVLIYGASGSVGSAGVQVAKALGAEVTGVCSTTNVDLVRSIGADHVIDYRTEDYSSEKSAYDIIFDAVGKTTFGRAFHALKPGGIFLEAGMTLGVIRSVIWSSIFGNKKAKIMATGLRKPAERAKDLQLLKEWLEAGKIKPVIDKTYSFDEIVQAHVFVDKGRKRGNVVVKVIGNQ